MLDSARMLDLNQPMSEEESREWQERCDAVILHLFVENGTVIILKKL